MPNPSFFRSPSFNDLLKSFCAAQDWHRIDELLETRWADTDLNSLDEEGLAPLHRLLFSGAPLNLIQRVIARGADPSALTDENVSAIECALTPGIHPPPTPYEPSKHSAPALRAAMLRANPQVIRLLGTELADTEQLIPTEPPLVVYCRELYFIYQLEGHIDRRLAQHAWKVIQELVEQGEKLMDRVALGPGPNGQELEALCYEVICPFAPGPLLYPKGRTIWQVLEELAARGLHIPNSDGLRGSELSETLRSISSFRQFFGEDEYPNLNDTIVEIFASSDSLLDCDEFYAAAQAAVVEDQFRVSGAELLKILPRLLGRYHLERAAPIIQMIDYAYDNKVIQPGRHSMEAELMALLLHPATFPRQPQEKVDNKAIYSHAGGLTYALTSIVRLNANQPGEQVTELSADIWARIGCLTHSFLRWRYESSRLQVFNSEGRNLVLGPALLETYGQNLAERRRTLPLEPVFEREAWLGSNFIFLPGSKAVPVYTWLPGHERRDLAIDSRTRFELHRGAMVVAHPEYGALVIRNSSPIFGRSLMPHPAYWCPADRFRGFSLKNPNWLSRGLLASHFIPVLEAYAKRGVEEMDAVLNPLTLQAWALKADIAAWKFDTDYTSAWYGLDADDPTKAELAGGQISGGFPALVNRLKELYALQTGAASRGQVPPELAFFDPCMPPFSPELFPGPDGRFMSSLPLNENVLEALESLATGQTNPSLLQSTGVRSFLQHGFNSQSELVLIHPSDIK